MAAFGESPRASPPLCAPCQVGDPPAVVSAELHVLGGLGKPGWSGERRRTGTVASPGSAATWWRSLIQLSGGGDGPTADRRRSAAACVLVTGLVRWAALRVSQVCTALSRRGAGIPGRALDGGQAADDRSDRAVLAGSLAGSREVPGIFGRLGSARLLLARQGRLLVGGVDPAGSLSVMLAISSGGHLHGPAHKRWPGLPRRGRPGSSPAGLAPTRATPAARLVTEPRAALQPAASRSAAAALCPRGQQIVGTGQLRHADRVVGCSLCTCPALTADSAATGHDLPSGAASASQS